MLHSELLKTLDDSLKSHERYRATLADVDLVKSKLDNVLDVVDTYTALTNLSDMRDVAKSWQEPTIINLVVCYVENDPEEDLTLDNHLIIEFTYDSEPTIYANENVGEKLKTYLQEFFTTELELETEPEVVSKQFINTVNDHLTMLKVAEHSLSGDTGFNKWTLQRCNDEHSLFIRNTKTGSIGCVNVDWYEAGDVQGTVYGDYTVSTGVNDLSLFEYVRNVIPSEKNVITYQDDALGYMFEAISNAIEFKNNF